MRKRLLALLFAVLTVTAAACTDNGDNQAQVFDPAVAPKDAEDPFAAYVARDRYCAARGVWAEGCTPIIPIDSDETWSDEQFYIDREVYCQSVEVPSTDEISQMRDDAPIEPDQFGCALHEDWGAWDEFVDAIGAMRNAQSLGYTPAQVLKLEGMTNSSTASTCTFECLTVLMERMQQGSPSYGIDELAQVLDASAFAKDDYRQLGYLFTAYDVYRGVGLDQAEALRRVTWLDKAVGIDIYKSASLGYYWAVTKATEGKNDGLALYAVEVALAANEGMGYPGTLGDPDQVQWLIDQGYPVHEALYIVHHEQIEADLDNPHLSPADRAAFEALIG